ncbi:MAG: alpha/beta hydrolase-fold protein [Candidatus Wallbacteria bacterium]|nr:alpha/beta hydrolase-fold protein [Candidatus Wallbacteria bacterium]
MKCFILFLLNVFILSAVTASAAETMNTAEITRASSSDICFSAEVFFFGGHSLPYRIHVPLNGTKSGLPVILFLHGSGERGSDNQITLVNGPLKILEFTIRKKMPAIIIVPQCPADLRWVDVDWATDTHEMPVNISWPLDLAVKLADSVIESRQADKSRFYLTGLSMGGFGTWDLLQRMPEKFAAALPLCGGGDTKLAAKVATVPVWAFHGSVDTTVKPVRSRSMVEAVKGAGGSIKYTEYQGEGHNVWAQTYASSEVLLWLFDQKLKK